MASYTRRELVTRGFGVAAGLLGAGVVINASRVGAAGETTLERIKREKRIRVGIFNQPPWGMKLPNGTVTGETPEVLLAALRPLGVERLFPIITEFAALIPGLAARRFDAIAAGLYTTPVRCAQVAFGDPDLQMGDAFVVKKGNPKNLHSYDSVAKNPTAVLGTGRGSAEVQYAEEAGIPSSRLVLFPDNFTALAGLQAGRVDVISFTAATAAALLAKANDPNLERALPFTEPIDPKTGKERRNYPAVAFRKEDTDLRDAYNAQLKKLKANGELLSILTRFGMTKYELPPEGLTAAELCKG